MDASQVSIIQSIKMFIDNVSLSRSENTARTYSNGLNVFLEMLDENQIDKESSVSVITEEFVSDFSKHSFFKKIIISNLIAFSFQKNI